MGTDHSGWGCAFELSEVHCHDINGIVFLIAVVNHLELYAYLIAAPGS